MRLCVDGLLSLVFFVQHSWMVRPSFRGWVARWIPVPYFASFYAVVSSLFLLAVVLLWQGPLDMVFSVDAPLRWAVRGLFFLGILVFAWSGSVMADWDPFGWRDLRLERAAESVPASRLIVAGPFRWVRHPQYLAALLLIWSEPDLTTDRVALNILWSGWILVAIQLEERDLRRRYGQAYDDYGKDVPMLLPGVRWPGT
jgi:protein-S-isoprenylcysteine O-methyltransferase Ste14